MHPGSNYAAQQGQVPVYASGGSDSAGDLDHLLGETVADLVEWFDALFAGIWLREPLRDVLVLKAADGPAAEQWQGFFAQVPIGAGNIGAVAATGQPVFADTLSNDPSVCDPEWIWTDGPVCLAGLPLSVGGEVHGVIALCRRRAFERRDVRMLETLAGGVGLGIENIQVRAEAARFRADLAAVGAVAHEVAQEWETEQLVATVVDQARRALDAPATMLWLVDSDVQELTLAAASGLSSDIRDQIGRLSIGRKTATGRAALTGELQVVEDFGLLRPEGDALDLQLAPEGAAGFLAVPLAARGRLVGVLGIALASSGGRDSRMRRVASALADLFATAVEAAGLAARLRDTNARLVTASIEAQERAEALEEEKQGREQFISIVAHELRSPLTVLLGFSRLLQRRRLAKDRRETALRAIESQVKRLERLTRELRDISLMAMGRFVVQPEPVDLVGLVRDVVEEQRATTDRHVIALDTMPRELVGMWDGQRIAQALSNLISNAIKYSPEGGGIRVFIRQETGTVQLGVQDSGVGLAPVEFELIFRPYSRLHRTRTVGGTGLGLYVTKGIVEAHGGRISVESPGPGRGSTFTLVLLYLGSQVPGATARIHGVAGEPERAMEPGRAGN